MSFAEFDKKVGSRKTGFYGHGVDMYTRRDGSNERVFRVQWYERNSKYPTREDYKKASRKQMNASRNGFYCPAGREWVEKNQLFPYNEEGLVAALAFSESVQPMREEFKNREE